MEKPQNKNQTDYAINPLLITQFYSISFHLETYSTLISRSLTRPELLLPLQTQSPNSTNWLRSVNDSEFKYKKNLNGNNKKQTTVHCQFFLA